MPLVERVSERSVSWFGICEEKKNFIISSTRTVMRNVLMFNYAKGHFLYWELASARSLLRYFGDNGLYCAKQGLHITSRFSFFYLVFLVGA